LRCRGEEQMGGLYTGLTTKHIALASRMVSEYTGMVVQPHKAIVGANAFAHESGIHQDGMLKHKGTYEIMSPEDIGLVRADASGIVLGKLSGRHALKQRLNQLGYEIDGKELDDVFKRFKSVAEKKKSFSDDDLETLLSDEVFQPETLWSLSLIQVVCGTSGLSTATVKLEGPDGLQHIGMSVGTGPVDAAYKAVDTIVKAPVTLLEYSMNAVTEGIDAIAHTRVQIRAHDPLTVTNPQTGSQVPRSYSGTGASEDVVVSSVRAYISALNKMLTFSIVKRQPSTGMRSDKQAAVSQ